MTDCHSSPAAPHAGGGRHDGPLRRQLVRSVCASSVGMVWVAIALGTPLPLLLSFLGASGLQIGLAVAVQQFTVIAQIPSSLLAERLHCRRHYWGVTAMLHRLLWATPALVLLFFPRGGWAAAWALLTAIAVSSLLNHAAAPVWFSWMADLVPERISGRFWGIRQSVTMSVLVVAVWLAGRILDHFELSRGQEGTRWGFVWLFVAAAIAGCADIGVHWTVHEPAPAPAEPGRPLAQRIGALLREHDFRLTTAGLGVWLFSLGLVGPFGILYLRGSLGASYEMLAVLSVAGSLGALASGVGTGKLIDRYGARRVGSLLMLAAPAIGSAWFFVGPQGATFALPGFPAARVPLYLAVLVPAHFLGGAMSSGIGLSQIQLISSIVPRRGRTLALAVHWSLVGLLAAVGPLVGGRVMDLLAKGMPHWHLPGGTLLSFFHVLLAAHLALAAFVAAPLLSRVHSKGTGLGFGFALAWLRLGNPLRAISAFYSAQVGRLLEPAAESRPEADDSRPTRDEAS